MTHEQLRRRYRPKQVRLLFVGESPPASGRFFYARDSGLYRAMFEVFAMADPAIGHETFLDVFQSAGCYLVDLCPEPVNHLPAQQRRAACAASEARLARAILRLRPQMIASLLRSVEGNVANAITAAHWKGPTIGLPYPGRWQHAKADFTERLAPVILRLLERTTTGHAHPGS